MLGNEIREEMQSDHVGHSEDFRFCLEWHGKALESLDRKLTTCVFNSGCCSEHRGKEGKGEHKKTEYEVTAIFRTRCRCLGPE